MVSSYQPRTKKPPAPVGSHSTGIALPPVEFKRDGTCARFGTWPVFFAEFTSVSAMFDTVPAAIRPGPSGEWTKLKVAAANDVLARDVLGHAGRITARAQVVGIAPGTVNPRVAGLPRARLAQAAIGEIPVSLYVYFDANAKGQVAAINPGDQIAITGTISRVQLTGEPNGHGVRLNVDLMNCRLDARG